MKDYEVVWNGTMERTGDHPGLSNMTGPSSALLNMNLPEAQDHGNEGLERSAPRTYRKAGFEREIRRMLKAREPHAEIMRTLGVTQWAVQKVVRKFPGLRRKIQEVRR